MPFIEVIEAEEAEGQLKATYDEIIEHYKGRLPPVLKVMGLNAPALDAVKSLNWAASFGGTVLGRREEEIVATAVSVWNECPY